MEDVNFLEKLATQFGQNASVKNVFGDPVHAGDKIIIPVAQIAYGLGGGYGQGGKRNIKKTPKGPEGAVTPDDSKLDGEGAGGGGGMYAKPKGVYEISAKCTRFIPAGNYAQLFAGFTIGFMLRGWFLAKHRKKALH